MRVTCVVQRIECATRDTGLAHPWIMNDQMGPCPSRSRWSRMHSHRRGWAPRRDGGRTHPPPLSGGARCRRRALGRKTVHENRSLRPPGGGRAGQKGCRLDTLELATFGSPSHPAHVNPKYCKRPWGKRKSRDSGNSLPPPCFPHWSRDHTLRLRGATPLHAGPGPYSEGGSLGRRTRCMGRSRVRVDD